MSFASEFKSFALRGNVVDLAVGVIVGAAFGKIVDSAVKDLLMPLVNLLTGGGVDFSNKYWVLHGSPAAGASLLEAQKVATVFAWGNFLTMLINFLLLALVVFLMVRQINRLQTLAQAQPVPEPAAPQAPAEPSEEVLLLREIRDRLKPSTISSAHDDNR